MCLADACFAALPVCQAGFGENGCQLCTYNTWSSGNILDGDSCYPCAQGAVSARGSTSGIQCYERMQSADDIFHLSDDSAWTTDSARSVGSCEYSCRLNTACMMYRFSADSSVCQTFLEDAGVYPSQQLAFKVSDGADYAVYTVASSLTAGVLLRTVSDITFEGCMQACSGSGACGLITFPTTAARTDTGLCRLWTNELDSEWISFVHIQGPRLYSDQFV